MVTGTKNVNVLDKKEESAYNKGTNKILINQNILFPSKNIPVVSFLTHHSSQSKLTGCFFMLHCTGQQYKGGNNYGKFIR